MIRIKVFSFRQAINRFFDIASVVLLATFTLIIIILFACIFGYNIKDVDASEISIITYETFSKEILIDKFIENEIAAFSLLEKAEDEKNFEIVKNNSSVTSVMEVNQKDEKTKLEVELKPFKEYTIPTKYEVEKYENGNIRVGNTKITNYSKLNLNLKELEKPSEIKITSDDNFLIFHTHATESYTIPENPNIVNYRTTDKSCSVVTVGETLANELNAKSFSCTHDKTLHDYPSYNGAYKSSLNTVLKHLEKEEYDFVLDLHRDALSSNSNFRPTVEINGEKAAQLMFVVGTDSSGLTHAEWIENLKLALMIQNRANEMYPGLFRNLNLSSSRYNQQVSNGAFIIEVGATGNTLQEAKNSMKYLANVIDSFK